LFTTSVASDLEKMLQKNVVKRTKSKYFFLIANAKEKERKSELVKMATAIEDISP
jgi:hypothetical protein